ncbi:hypothetical protein EON65_42140 [archaeon]|nr:MAG: hypothetical protein EON65_42140 [archaeon]
MQIGDEVCGLNWSAQSNNSTTQSSDGVGGCFAQYVRISYTKLSLKPPQLSFVQAASCLLAGCAAYQAVHQCGKVGVGSRVLILGGNTCVGLLAAQLCRAAGAEFVAVTCSASSADAVQRAADPHLLVRHDQEKWQAHPLIRHMDFVLDLVGTANTLELLKTGEGLVSTGGAFVSLANPHVGVIAQAHPPFSYARFYLFKQSTEHQDIILGRVVRGQLKGPEIRLHPFLKEGIMEMLQGVRSQKSRGKHVLCVVPQN